MRMAFGLVSLLVVVAIILYVGSIYYPPMLTRGKAAQVQAQQMSGREAKTGKAATQAVQWAGVNEGGQFRGVKVVAITDPTGGLVTYYGLQSGDVVVKVGGIDFASVAMDDPKAAVDWILQGGYEKSAPLTVIRNGQVIDLPQGTAGTASGAGLSPLQRQLQGIQQQSSQDVPTH